MLVASFVRRKRVHWQCQKGVFRRPIFRVRLCYLYLVVSILHVADRSKFHACGIIYDQRSYRALTIICAQHASVDGGCIIYADPGVAVGFYHYRYGLTSCRRILIKKSCPFHSVNTFADHLFCTWLCDRLIDQQVVFLFARVFCLRDGIYT